MQRALASAYTQLCAGIPLDFAPSFRPSLESLVKAREMNVNRFFVSVDEVNISVYSASDFFLADKAYHSVPRVRCARVNQKILVRPQTPLESNRIKTSTVVHPCHVPSTARTRTIRSLYMRSIRSTSCYRIREYARANDSRAWLASIPFDCTSIIPRKRLFVKRTNRIQIRAYSRIRARDIARSYRCAPGIRAILCYRIARASVRAYARALP